MQELSYETGQWSIRGLIRLRARKLAEHGLQNDEPNVISNFAGFHQSQGPIVQHELLVIVAHSKNRMVTTVLSLTGLEGVTGLLPEACADPLTRAKNPALP